MSDRHLTTDNTPPHGASLSAGEAGWSVTLGCILAGLTPALGVLVFLALRAVVGPENITTLGYIVLFPLAQVLGALLAFLAGYSSYDLAERRKLHQPVVLQAGFTTLLVALPIFLGVRGLIGADKMTSAGQVALVAGSLVVGLGVLALITRAGQD